MSLQVDQSGDTVSIAFGDEQFVGENVLPDLRNELKRVLGESKPGTARFDLSGVVLCSSEMLGLLVSLTTKGVKVVLANASKEVRDVIEMTKLDRIQRLTVEDQPA